MATINIIVHPEWDLTEKVAVGDLTLAEIVNEIKRFHSGPITKRVLWDFSQATFASIGAEDISQVSRTVAPLIKRTEGSKVAVVAATDLAFGFSRMYQGYREIEQAELPYMACRTRQEAIDWLLSDSK